MAAPLSRGQLPQSRSLSGGSAPAVQPAGALLQDYLTELCFYLRKGDLSLVKKCAWGSRPAPPERRSCLSWPQMGQLGAQDRLRRPSQGVCAAGFEPLREDRDLACRRFYRNFLEDVTELARNVP